jgi:hypothetical protein
MADDTYSRGYRGDAYPRLGKKQYDQSTDPLAELARLIGQDDPFATQGRTPAQPQYDGRRRAAAEPYHDAPPSTYGRADDSPYPEPYSDSETWDEREPQVGDALDDRHAERPAYRDAPFAHDRPYQDAYADDPHDDLDAAGYDRAYAEEGDGYGHAAYASDGYGQNYGSAGSDDGELDEPAPRPSRRSRFATIAAMLALVFVGTVGAFAYRTVFSGPSGPPPIIRSDGAPNKIVPTAQHADNVSGKQIYDRLSDRAQNERMVPREEQPVNIPEPSTPAPPLVQAAGSAAAPMSGGVSPQSAWPAPAASQGAPAGGEPRKIRTVTIKPDQGGGEQAVPPPATQPRVAAAQPASTGSVPTQSSSAANAPLALTPQPSSTSPPVRTSAVAPAASIPAAAAAGANGYFVQLSAQRSEEEAQASFRAIQAKYASILGGRQPLIRRKEVSGKGVFFGAQVGPLSREEAVQMCESLKSAGGACLIQRN